MKIALGERQAFAVVVDTGSITSAAQQLDPSVSATSRALARREMPSGRLPVDAASPFMLYVIVPRRARHWGVERQDAAAACSEINATSTS
ncbi:hypothetical protein WT05_08245 [Burkholderia stagnalis]|nr:hypothetical protein WT05_08245 [Burkholderia stagnalis]